MQTDWLSIFPEEELDRVEQFVSDERDKFYDIKEIYPPDDKLFRCFQYFNIADLKVVILGQDPYHGPGQANGLSFAVEPGVKKPPSLRNIEKELGHEADIESWARQGVLMLNACMTVVDGIPGTPRHFTTWKPFTKAVIDYVNEHREGIVFVAWGGFAYQLLKKVDQSKHTLLVSSHPSPLGAYKSFQGFPPFMGSGVFQKIECIQW